MNDWADLADPVEDWSDLAEPVDMPAGEAFKRGFGSEMSRAYAGIAPFIGTKGKTREELEAERALLDQSGGFPASAGRFTAQALEMLPTAFIPGAGPLGVASRVAGSAGLSALFSPEDRGTEALLGGAGALGGEALGAGLSKLIRGPVAQEGVKEAYEAGLRPSFAQAIGGGAKRFEEAMTSAPLLGPSIEKQQLRAVESFNKSTLQQIVDDLNKGVGKAADIAIAGGRTTVPKKIVEIDIEPSAAGFKSVKNAVSDAYGRIVENTSGVMTPEFESAISNIRDLAKEVPDKEVQINRIIDDVISKFSPGKRTSGETLKSLDSKLAKIAERYSKLGGDDAYVGDAAMELRSQLHDMIGSQDAYAKQALENANRAWFKVKRMENAMTSTVGNELATPGSLLQSLRNKNRAQYATGDLPMQPWARSAQDIIGNRYPESGTAGRLQAKDLLAGGATGFLPGLAAYYAGKGAYAPAIQDFLVEQSIKDPSLKRLLAMEFARKASPVFGAATGSSFGR